MASVYILYSLSADKFYVGSTKDLVKRIDYHQTKEFSSSFTAKYPDWKLFYEIAPFALSLWANEERIQ
jgi:putative endonuclease